MKQLVTQVLSRDEIKKIDFTAVGMKVSPIGFSAVKTRIDAGKIEVQYSRRLARHTAQYVHTHNRMLLSFRSLDDDPDREALIVHECVHAIADIAGKKQLVAHSEASAYVAQCLYYYYRSEKDIKDGMMIAFDDRLLKTAWQAAATARTKGTLTDADLEPLLKAIARDGMYRRKHKDFNQYDGV